MSGKKTRIGTIDKGFHFLGIQYPETRPLDNTTVTQDTHGAYNQASSEQKISSEGGVETLRQSEEHPRLESNIIPHPRTLRKAREQVKSMVIDGVSPLKIKRYLHRWCQWWVRTSASWLYQDLLLWFLKVCWDRKAAGYAAELLHQHAVCAMKINTGTDFQLGYMA